MRRLSLLVVLSFIATTSSVFAAEKPRVRKTSSVSETSVDGPRALRSFNITSSALYFLAGVPNVGVQFGTSRSSTIGGSLKYLPGSSRGNEYAIQSDGYAASLHANFHLRGDRFSDGPFLRPEVSYVSATASIADISGTSSALVAAGYFGYYFSGRNGFNVQPTIGAGYIHWNPTRVSSSGVSEAVSRPSDSIGLMLNVEVGFAQ